MEPEEGRGNRARLATSPFPAGPTRIRGSRAGPAESRTAECILRTVTPVDSRLPFPRRTGSPSANPTLGAAPRWGPLRPSASERNTRMSAQATSPQGPSCQRARRSAEHNPPPEADPAAAGRPCGCDCAHSEPSTPAAPAAPPCLRGRARAPHATARAGPARGVSHAPPCCKWLGARPPSPTPQEAGSFFQKSPMWGGRELGLRARRARPLPHTACRPTAPARKAAPPRAGRARAARPPPRARGLRAPWCSPAPHGRPSGAPRPLPPRPGGPAAGVVTPRGGPGGGGRGGADGLREGL